MSLRRRSHRLRGALIACAALATSPQTLHATIWDGGGFGANWSDSFNWDTDVEPSSTDNVFFPTPVPNGVSAITLNLGGSPFPVLGENAQALVFQDSYTLSGAYLTLSNTGTGTVTTVAGTSCVINSSLWGSVGLSKGGPGTLTLTGDNAYSGETRVAFGTLRLEGGGSIGEKSAGDARVGISSALAASAVVSGAGTKWFATNSFLVGTSGSVGTLSVEAGGSVTSPSAKVGTESGSTGTATVTGSGSSWTMSGNLLVGEQGSGTLIIQAGGTVSAATTSIGASLGNGAVTVSGVGSTLTNSNQVAVGESGPGSLTVEAGGMASSAAGIVGSDPAAPGTATITGAGSTWTTEMLIVGSNGTGTLNIDAGGSVACDFAILGGGDGGGTANVGGAGSAWMISGNLSMGEGPATGTLSITGGTVSIGGNVSGSFASGTSTIVLDGGTLDLTGGNIGDAAPISVLNFQAGTLKNVAQINGGAGLTKTTAGTLTLDGVNTYTGMTTVGEGVLLFLTSHTTGSAIDIADGATAQIVASAATPNNVVLKTGSINTHASGKLDLVDNKLIVSGGGVGSWNGSAYTGVAGLVDSGRGSAGNAMWDGAGGIVTSDTRAINNGDLVSIGVAKVSEVRTVADTETTSFAGQTVLGSDVLAMVTWGGDANLDGKINIDDYGRIDGNVGQSGSVFGWSKGDFNYDGKINIDDYGIIDGNINRQGAAFLAGGGGTSAALHGLAAVPEPATPALVAGATALLLQRRRRHAIKARHVIF